MNSKLHMYLFNKFVDEGRKIPTISFSLTLISKDNFAKTCPEAGFHAHESHPKYTDRSTYLLFSCLKAVNKH